MALDLLRVLASQFVLVFHATSFFGIFKSLEPPYIPYLQNVAVVIFFLLSGFLISYTVMRKLPDPQYGMRQFLIDRFSRIYSAYLPILFLIIIIDLYHIYYNSSSYVHLGAFDIKTFFVNLFMFQDFPLFNIGTSFGSARPFWTIAIEWWIYLSFGYLFFAIYRRLQNNLSISIVHVVIFLGVSIVPVYNIVSGRGNGLTMVWILGALIMLLLFKTKLPVVKPTHLYFISFLFLILSAMRAYKTKEAYDLLFASLLAIALFFLIYALQNNNCFKSKLLNRCISVMAKYSFTLYLIHYSILEIIRLYIGSISPYILLGISFVFCNLLSLFIAYFTEMRYKSIAERLKTWTEVFFTDRGIRRDINKY